LILTKSCFNSNVSENFQNLIAVDENSSLTSDSNYAFQGDESFCTSNSNSNDTICTGFNSSFCEAAVTLQCYSNWESLSEAIETANIMQEPAIFTLCEDSVLEVPAFSPIQLRIPDITIRCGSSGVSENRCIIVGGTIQLQVSKSAMLQGITMEKSSLAAVHAIGEESSSLLIEDCTFSEHFGLAAVISYNGSLIDSFADEERSQVETLQHEGNGMVVDVRDSVFVDQNVTFSPLSVFGGNLILNSTIFDRNNGFLSAGIGVWHEGNLSLETACFDEQVSTPNVFIDIDSVFNLYSSIKAENSNDICTDILHGDQCFLLEKQDCNPFVVAQSCYDSWMDLGKAIVSSFAQVGNECSFTICEGAILDASLDITNNATPIVISGTKVTIKCGELGTRNCIVRGGRSHFKLEGVGETIFQGLTFEEAEFASIIAAGQNSSFATFKRCTWRHHVGETTMLINPEDDSTTTDLLANSTVTELLSSAGNAMTVLVDDCTFQNNQVKFSTIANLGGNLNLIETLMINNTESRLGVIAALSGASIGLSWSCFTGNSALSRGIIFLDQNSTLSFNGNTFGADNEVSSHDCEQIFKETLGPTCAKSNSSCEGECQRFESRTCRVSSFSFGENITLIPTNTPSSFPTTNSSIISPTFWTNGSNTSQVKISSTKQPILGGLAISGIMLGIMIIFLLLGGAVFMFRSKEEEISLGKKHGSASSVGTDEDDNTACNDEDELLIELPLIELSNEPDEREEDDKNDETNSGDEDSHSSQNSDSSSNSDGDYDSNSNSGDEDSHSSQNSDSSSNSDGDYDSNSNSEHDDSDNEKSEQEGKMSKNYKEKFRDEEEGYHWKRESVLGIMVIFLHLSVVTKFWPKKEENREETDADFNEDNNTACNDEGEPLMEPWNELDEREENDKNDATDPENEDSYGSQDSESSYDSDGDYDSNSQYDDDYDDEGSEQERKMYKDDNGEFRDEEEGFYKN